jgi:hypothetical protein
MAPDATTGDRGRPPRKAVLVGAAVVVLLAAAAAFIALESSATSHPAHRASAPTLPSITTTSPLSTAPRATTTSTSDTAGVPGPAGPGFVAGQVTAVGDSVMLDYEDPLKTSIPGINVLAAVSRQWTDGETVLEDLKASGDLGGDVIVALGTNGPITDADFDNMMAILGGASRVVFVNVHVDRPWQDPNNTVITAGATRYPNAVVADWASLAAQNPQWFGADGTHLPIDGPGADALAALVATTLANG